MWFLYSLITLLGWGLYQFSIKLVQTTKVSATLSTLLFYLFAALTMAVKLMWDHYHAGEGLVITKKALLITAFGGFAVAIGTLYLGYALQSAPGSKVFPIINLALVISSILSIIVFHEFLNLKVILGIVFAVSSIVLISMR